MIRVEKKDETAARLMPVASEPAASAFKYYLAAAASPSGHKSIRTKGQRATFMPARLVPVGAEPAASAFKSVKKKY